MLTAGQLLLFPRLIRDPYFDNEDIAEILDIKPEYFLNSFEAATGMTFSKWRKSKGIETVFKMGRNSVENETRIAKQKFSIQSIDALKQFKTSIKAIATSLGLSEKEFRYKVREIFSTSAEELRNRQRLIYAKEKLKDPNILIKEIVEELGYAANASFRDMFLADEGITPLEYRKQHKNRVKRQTAEEKIWLEKVIKQLRKSHISLKTIAEQNKTTTMKTYAGFAQRFERLTGLTPTQWREENAVVIPTAEIIRQVKGHAYNLDLSISQMADIYDLSAASLTKRFKRQENMSITGYRIHIGVLMNDEDKIQDIQTKLIDPRMSAVNVGTLHRSNFYAIDAFFKRHTGQSIKQWREDREIATLKKQPDWIPDAKKAMAKEAFAFLKDFTLTGDLSSLDLSNIVQQAFETVSVKMEKGARNMRITFERAVGIPTEEWIVIASRTMKSREGSDCLECREQFNLPAEGLEPRLTIPKKPSYALPLNDPALYWDRP